MGTKTLIQYTDSTFNEFFGCPGCELWVPGENGLKVCYAGKMITRFANTNPKMWPETFTKPIWKGGAAIRKALKWADLTGLVRHDKPWLNGLPRVIFVNDMSDSFAEFYYKKNKKVPMTGDWLLPFINDIEASPHVFLLLTKRPSRAATFFLKEVGYIPENIWLGTSVTYSHTAKRLDYLLSLRDICRGKLWVSMEPMYPGVTGASGLMDNLTKLDWVVLGGESGPGTQRASQLNEMIEVINHCKDKGVSVFIKQLGSAYGPHKGGDWADWDPLLKYREMPYGV